ncbi:class I SAM-dependent RNA methyltransferase [Magnetospirillum molischianum]|uniref:Putative enzyme n=1 Tax=Magnetospirillum molischianum DSM 120 TaxID=1150626 RepID=H8FRW4_MAGML|nr:TRAM domain-containing protein [Magnetospirillum molischianum]CCG41102.1 putative enzyme [Magnetospirillum molischianum DSM 120]
MRKPVRRPRAAAKRQVSSRLIELEIEQVGAQGDGVARLDGNVVFVPFTVAGDRVLARIEGQRGDGLTAALVEVQRPGPGRADPVCPHFGRCGGCTLQHLDQAAHASWKSGVLSLHLARAGIGDEMLAPLVSVPPGTRRRAVFAWTSRRGEVTLGFNARASHAVINLEACPLLDPALVALLEPLRVLLGAMVRDGSGDATVTLTEGGPDLLIEGEARLDLFGRETLARFAETADLARLHWRRPGTGFAEPIARRRPALVRFGGVAVEPPPGAFLQPSPEGERAIADRVVAALAETSGPIADLYAGCGSFSLPLVRLGAVHAVEGEVAPLDSLGAAARAAGLAITTEIRDLARRPLTAVDLAPYRAVVLDPPRAGAAAQVAELARRPDARKGPDLAAMVSCNPATLARDLRVLIDGGWTLIQIMPIDQFPWSAHLEAVAILRR